MTPGLWANISLPRTWIYSQRVTKSIKRTLLLQRPPGSFICTSRCSCANVPPWRTGWFRILSTENLRHSSTSWTKSSVLWTTYTALDWCIEISRWATWLLFALLRFFYTPRFNEVERGVYWYHLVRLSFCGQNRVCSVSSTILIGSISYLHILSSNLRRWVACNAGFKIQKFEILANFLNL